MDNVNRYAMLSVFALLVVGMTFFGHAQDDAQPLMSALELRFKVGTKVMQKLSIKLACTT